MKILYQGNEGAYSQLAAVEVFPKAKTISSIVVYTYINHENLHHNNYCFNYYFL